MPLFSGWHTIAPFPRLLIGLIVVRRPLMVRG
jgi:hypothetical protein